MRSSLAPALVLAAAAAAVVTFSATKDAHALGPVDVEVAAKVGVASNPDSGGTPNPLGFGVGARGGVSFMHFYGGLSLMYYLGSSQDVSISGLPGAGTASVSEHALMYGVEGGYGFTLLDLLTIRPQLGVGNATLLVSGPGSGSSNLYLEPGVTGLVSLGGWFVGADANLLFLPGQDGSTTAFTLHGQVGLKF